MQQMMLSCCCRPSTTSNALEKEGKEAFFSKRQRIALQH
jgi:hypothetical protein